MKKKPYLRLTILFTSLILFPGAILSYFGIQNVVNQKELSEKLVLEEEKKILDNFTNKFNSVVDSAVYKFSSNVSRYDNNRSELLRVLDSLTYISNSFLINENREYLIPRLHTSNISLIYSNTSSLFFSKKYLTAQKLEFQHNYNGSSIYYNSALVNSKNRNDSAVVLNALARLSMKQSHFDLARKYYNKLIFEFSTELDQNRFPLIYYAIQQILKNNSSFETEWILESCSKLVRDILLGEIVVNTSTKPLINSIMEWINSENNDGGYKYFNLNEDISKILNLLSFINENKNIISEFQYKTYNKFTGVNGCDVLQSANSSTNILLYNYKNRLYGSQLETMNIANSLSQQGITQNKYEYQYEIKVTGGTEYQKNDYNKYNLATTFSRFNPSYKIKISLHDEKSFERKIMMLNWIYGISILLLIGGMFMGMVLIMQDFKREKYLSRLRSNFVSNVSHELKTPLTSIHMFTESILLGRVKKTKDQNEYLEIILKETERLKRLINNILDFSKSEVGNVSYHKREINLSEVVKSSIKELKYWLIEKKFNVIQDIENDILIFADPDALKQAVINLMTNAINYSVKVKEIKILLKIVGKYIIIEVTDKGIGIAPDKLDKIFEKFYRVENESKNISEGTGLGLSVVKEIIKAHNGEIFVESKINIGSKFTIQLTLT